MSATQPLRPPKAPRQSHPSAMLRAAARLDCDRRVQRGSEPMRLFRLVLLPLLAALAAPGGPPPAGDRLPSQVVVVTDPARSPLGR